MSDHVRRWQVDSTLAILVLSTASSLLGLSYPGHYTDAAELLARTQAQDAGILLVGVPVLATGLYYARRGSSRGQVVWLGALAFMLYMWASYALTMAFNAFFLGYVALFGLSLFTLAGGLLRLNPAPIAAAVEGRIPRRVFAAFLGLTAAGLAFIWLSDIVPAILSGSVPLAIQEFGPTGTHTYVLDLGVVVPSLAIVGAWLWRGREWGYALAGVLLTFTAVLAPPLTALMVIDATGGVEMTTAILVGSLVPPLIGAVLAVWYLLTIGRGGTVRRPDEDPVPG